MEAFRILEYRDVQALASPVRQQLLERLSTPNSAAGLAAELGTSRQRIGYHMRALEQADLIEAVEERRVRGLTERLYRTRPLAFVMSPHEGGEPDRVRERFSWAALINLVARTLWDLVSLRRKADAAGKRLATLALDAELSFETPAERKAFAEDLIDAVERVVRCHERPRSDKTRAFRLVLGAYPKAEEVSSDAGQDAQH